MKRGYARVSTEEQDLARQIHALQQYGCDVIYTDKMRGTKDSRPDLDRMLSECQAGDTVVIQKLDRLGRSMLSLVQQIKGLTERKINFVSITDNFDLSTPVGLLSFHMIAAFAQFERDLISERTKNGLEQRKRMGVVLGPKPMSEEVLDEIRRMFVENNSISHIARTLKLSRPTIYRALEKYGL